MQNPLLSIICITYNHAAFIRQALDGFVMQKTEFPFEILVNDDASTDGTAEIIREYEAKYPHLFRCVYQTENQWGKKDPWKDVLFPMVRGKYAALCEGDDFWIDPLKLQKQVDFLEHNPDFSVCFHPVKVLWEDRCAAESVFPEAYWRFNKTEMELCDLLQRNFIQTNSVVYRWRFHRDSLDLIPDGILPEDWFIHLLHAQVGKIAFLPDLMAVYRKHRAGVWFNAEQSDEWFLKCGFSVCRFQTELRGVFGKDVFFDLKRLFFGTLSVALKNDDRKLFVRLKEAFPDEFRFFSEFPEFLYWKYFLLSKLSVKKSRKKYKNLYKEFKILRDHSRMIVRLLKNG